MTIILALACLGLGSGYSSAQPPLQGEELAAWETMVAPLAQLRDLEIQALKQVRSAEWSEAETALNAVDGSRANLGQENLTLFAQALCREAIGLGIQKRQGDKAMKILAWAERMAPGLPDVDYSKALLMVKGKAFRPTQAAEFLIDGITKTVKRVSDSAFLILNLLARVLIAFTLAFFLFGLILVLRNLKCLNHDFSHIFPYGTAPIVTWALTILIFLAPLIFRIPLLLTMGIWIAIGICYARPSERWVGGLALVFLAGLPFALTTLNTLLVNLNETGTRKIIQIEEREWGRLDLEQMEKWVAGHPSDSEAAFVLGSTLKKLGDYSRALSLYQVAEGKKQLAAAVANNRGNIYYALGEKDRVIPQYQQAIALNPNQGSAHYNLSQRLYSEARLTEGNKELSRAKELEPAMVDWFSRVGNPQVANSYLADEKIPPSLLQSRFWTPGQKQGDLEKELQALLYGGWDPRKVLIFYAILSVFTIVAALVLYRLGRSLACPRCGLIACKQCHRFAQVEGLCSQCYFMFVRKGGIDPQERVIKEFEIQRFSLRRKWLTRIFSLPLLGIGHFIRGKSGRGLALNVIFWLLLSKLVLPGGIFPEPFTLSYGSEWAGTAGAIAGLVILYLIGFASLISGEED
ncbi:MAG: tetratricopeptide repeat protein [bacterium]|nr:tetratricopeptide repeat protein [bacterium]